MKWQLTLERDDVDWPNNLLLKLRRWSAQDEKALHKIADLHNHQLLQTQQPAGEPQGATHRQSIQARKGPAGAAYP